MLDIIFTPVDPSRVFLENVGGLFTSLNELTGTWSSAFEPLKFEACRFGHLHSQIKRGTSNLPPLLDEPPKSNHIPVDLHGVPASCFFGDGYFKLMSRKQQAQAAPPRGAFSFSQLRRPYQLVRPITMVYCGHPQHQKIPTPSSPAWFDVSSDEVHQYFQLKDDHQSRRNHTESICHLDSNASPASEPGLVKRVALPLPVSSSASATEQFLAKKRKHRPANSSNRMRYLQNPMVKSHQLQQQNCICKVLNPRRKKRTELQKKACTPTITSISASRSEDEPAMA